MLFFVFLFGRRGGGHGRVCGFAYVCAFVKFMPIRLLRCLDVADWNCLLVYPASRVTIVLCRVDYAALYGIADFA